MKNKERIIWIGLVVIMLLISFFLDTKYKGKLREREQQNIELSNENIELKKIKLDNMAAMEGLKKEVENLKEQLESYRRFDEVILISLKEKGFTGELKDIVLDLQSHEELIPFEGGLGGTMRFFSDEYIHVLTDKWVYAYFEDGHIFGFMLLEYDIKDGEIRWKVIDSYLF